MNWELTATVDINTYIFFRVNYNNVHKFKYTSNFIDVYSIE